MFNFFLCELPLILTVSVKWKNEWNGDICKGTQDIEFERYWSFGLGATLGDIHTDFFFQLRDFSGKANSVILFHSKPTKFDEIRWSHFWENRNLIFFSSELLVILRVDRKEKYGLEIFTRRDYISNLNVIDQLVKALR